MDNIFCRICKKTFEKESGLHIHIKVHGISMSDYYHTYYPRSDKLDKKLIYFKDKETYFSRDFNTRENLMTWLRTADPDEVREYVTNFWEKRRKRKGLVLAPSQIELRSLDMPGKKYLSVLFDSYHRFFYNLGFKPRFVKDKFSAPPRDISRQKIIIDTREQQPLDFGENVRHEALKFGDYRLSNDTVSEDCYIERKSVMDFHGSLCKEFDRFEREVGRAESAGAYLVVVVEGTIEDLYTFANSPVFHKPLDEERRNEFAITSPQSVFSKMRKLMQDYSNIQFLFVKNREESARAIKRIFASNGEYQEVDLQYAYDTGNLI